MLSGSHRWLQKDGAFIKDDTLRLWDPGTGRLIRILKPHPGIFSSVGVFSPDGTRVLSGSSTFDGKDGLQLWETATGRLVRTLKGSPFVASVAFSPDGTRLASDSGDNTIKLWDAAKGHLIRTFKGHTGAVTSVIFSPNGLQLLSGSFDTKIKLWDAATGALLHTFEGHSGKITSVAFIGDGRRIVSGSTDTTIAIWDAATGGRLATVFADRRGEWMTLTPEGFFAGSSRGHELLAIVRGLEVFSIDRFYQVLHRPDLVREKLAGDPDGKVKAAGAHLDLAKLLASRPAP
jgi:WD40 repeat protein